jgi:NitT/TauT family transport system substrate-binding protein
MAQMHIMALRHSAFYTPLLMTMAGGFLRDEGLEHTYTPATPDNTVPDNIRKGACHLAQSAVATSFAALEKNEIIDIVHFAQINARDGFFIAARKPDANFNWRKLIGKKVLVDHFFQPMAMLRYGLYKQGVDIKALKVIDAGDVSAMERAFRKGEADYVHMQGPYPQQLEFEGLAHVVAAVGDAVGPVAFSSLCASREWLASDMAPAFMRAYRKSLAYVMATPAEEIAMREMKAGFFPGVQAQVLANTISAYQQLGCWEQDPQISRSSYESLLDVFMHSGLITRRHDYNKVVVQLPV